MKAELKKIDDKTFAVILGDHEIGRTKLQCDAQFHVNVINDALEQAYTNGEIGGYNEGWYFGYEQGREEGL